MGVFVDDLVDEIGGVAAFFHFDGGVGDGQRFAHTPIAGAVHPDAFASIIFQHIDGAGRGAFGFGIEGHAGPESGVEDHADGVFFDMVDDAAFGFDAGVGAESIEDEAGAFEFVFEVRSVDKDKLVVFGGEVDVLFEDFKFVAAVFVQADFADAKDGRFVEELGDDVDDFLREFCVFGFFGVDAKPGEVRQAELGRAFGFVFGQLAEVIVKAINGTAVEAGPKGWFANCGATSGDHVEVIVSDPADHVAMRFDVTHFIVLQARRRKPLWWWRQELVRWWDR